MTKVVIRFNMKEYQKKYYWANKDKIRARTKKWLTDNSDRVKGQRNEKYKVVRREAVLLYGNKCECCGEAEPRFLTFDHIKGGGKAHRATFGSSRLFLGWLIETGKRRKGIRLLCLNCNFAVQFGPCPHQLHPRVR